MVAEAGRRAIAFRDCGNHVTDRQQQTNDRVTSFPDEGKSTTK
jgi:hypothetical protein